MDVRALYTINFFRLLKQDRRLRKGLVNLFSQANGWRNGNLLNQMLHGHMVEITVGGTIKIIDRAND